MLQITIPATELWDDVSETFIHTKAQTLQLEHSLVSLSKWESKWCKPFLTKDEKTPEERLDYIRCMTVTQHVDPDVYLYLTPENIDKINKYIDAPMTATTFHNNKKGGGRSGEQITSELVYYWMVSYNIPFECQKWHLNRLLTLIRVCDVKNQPASKQSRAATLSQNAALNRARRQKLKSKG